MPPIRAIRFISRILSFPLFIGEGFIYFVIGMFAAFFGSMIGTYLFGYDAANDKA